MEGSTSRKPEAIVVGLDFSDLGRRAVEEAISIASRREHSELHVIIIAEQRGMLLELPGDAAPLPEKDAQAAAVERVGAIVTSHQPRGDVRLDRVAVYLVTGDPAKLIADLARALDASLIVVGTHGRKGVSRLILGSVAERVVRDAPCSVIVIRPPDFLGGEKVPDVEPPLLGGQPHMRHFEHRRLYHYLAPASGRVMPVG